MGHGEGPRPDGRAVPGNQVEIEHSRPPAPTLAAAEIPFDAFESLQHFTRIEAALHQRNGIGEIAARTTDCLVEDDRRCVEQVEVCIEPGNRSFDNAGRPAMTDVTAIGAEGNGVEVGQSKPFALNLSKGCLSISVAK